MRKSFPLITSPKVKLLYFSFLIPYPFSTYWPLSVSLHRKLPQKKVSFSLLIHSPSSLRRPVQSHSHHTWGCWHSGHTWTSGLAVQWPVLWHVWWLTSFLKCFIWIAGHHSLVSSHFSRYFFAVVLTFIYLFLIFPIVKYQDSWEPSPPLVRTQLASWL